MFRRWGLAAFVVGLLASFPALAEWQFEFRTGPDYRYGRPYTRAFDPWGRPAQYWGPPPRGRCWVELQPGPWGWQEVRRCMPGRGHGWGRRPFWD